MRAVVRLDVPTDDANLRAGRRRRVQKGQRRGRCARRLVDVLDPTMPARRPDMLPQQLAGLPIQQADVPVMLA